MTSSYYPPPAPDCPATSGRAEPRDGSLLAVLSLSFACVGLDNTKLVLAVPTLARELGAASPQSAVALEGVVTAGLVVYASLLLLGGVLSERFGARRMLWVGLSVFIAGSVLAASATSIIGLCASRAVVGLGAALLVPASLAGVEHVFGARRRARAVSIWTASFAAAGALGPVLGGWLLERWGWRALLVGNLPFAAAAMVGVLLLVPRDLPRRAAPLDLLGTLLGFGASVCVLLGLLGGAGDATRVLELGAGALLIGASWAWQRRARHPMLDPELFRRPVFRLTLLAILLAYLAFSGSSFVVAQYLQIVRGHSPSMASLLNLPLPLGLLTGTLVAPHLSARLGLGRALGASLALSFAGALCVATACFGQSDVALCLALIPFSAGAGCAFPSATQLILIATPPERAGSAAAISETAFELGGVLGIALLGSRLTALSGGGTAGLSIAAAALALGAAWWVGRRGARASASPGSHGGGGAADFCAK